MRQYLDVKDRYPDAMIFFRLGDFYEMFFEDAVAGARLLDLTLTTRDKGRDDAIPMCGVPHHAARGYIAKLTELGHTVVICDQVEDARLAKGLVKREVVRVVTPGIVLDDDVLDPKLPRYVVALVPASKRAVADARDRARAPGPPSPPSPPRAPGPVTPPRAVAAAELAAEGRRETVQVNERCGLAYLDATTGELAACELPLAAVADELTRIAPREVICAAEQLADTARLAPIRARVRVRWNAAPVPDDAGARGELGPLAAAEVGDQLDEAPLAARAAAAVLAYARATQPAGAL